MAFGVSLDEKSRRWAITESDSVACLGGSGNRGGSSVTALFLSRSDAEEYCTFKNSKLAWDEMISG